MRRIVGVACAVSLLAAMVAGPAQGTDQRAAHERQLRHANHVLAFFANQKHRWLSAPNHQKCSGVPWQKSCRIARQLTRYYTQRMTALRHELYRWLPHTNDWRTAVKLTQRIYPGTENWLLLISDREGGWGRFVMNHQGSGAGGWLQFMSGTFYAYVDDARRDVARRGFEIPSRVWSWTHPLGQALTGGYMRYTGQDGCHWCL